MPSIRETRESLLSTFARRDQSIRIGAAGMRIATGSPSEVTLSPAASTYVTGWSMSGGTTGQSLVVSVPNLPTGTVAVEVSITTLPNGSGDASNRHGWRIVSLQPNSDTSLSTAGRWFDSVSAHPAPATGTMVTQKIAAWLPVDPAKPLFLRLAREPGDTLDTWTGSAAVVQIIVTPKFAFDAPTTIQAPSGYNAWPMIQAVGSTLVCAYSTGSTHSVSEDVRAVEARESTDGGATWSAAMVIANTASYGEVAVGKGLDSQGRMLLWVRRGPSGGGAYTHHLYRRASAGSWSLISSPSLATEAVQISDIFAVPTVGLMALYFAGPYTDGTTHSWGIVTSADDGATWTQTEKEASLTKANWPTEASGAYVSSGKIIAISRCEDASPTSSDNAQWALRSDDYGATWTRTRTNVTDVSFSTPSLVYDSDAQTFTLYYYRRSWGVLLRREAPVSSVLDTPTAWPAPDALATGSLISNDAGNANACLTSTGQVVAWYSGTAPDTGVYVKTL